MADVSYAISSSNYTTADTLTVHKGQTLNVSGSGYYGIALTTAGDFTTAEGDFPPEIGKSSDYLQHASTSTRYTRVAYMKADVQLNTLGTYTMKKGYATSSSITRGQDITIIVDAPITLAFNANGGTGQPDNITQYTTSSSGSIQVPAIIPTRSGYEFLGWSTTQSEPGAGRIDYKPGDSVTININQTVTLYAVWIKKFNGEQYIKLNQEWAMIANPYPVGSIYMSVNSTDPSILFGGTWEQLQDRFLLGAGSTYSAGETGGEATHTLTVNEIPAHTHSNSVSHATDGTAVRLACSGYSQYASISTASAGGGKAHNNMPPYLVVYMWKRIA